MTTPNNREKARLAVTRLEQEIATREAVGETLPINRGALHLGLICQILGVGRATVQQNPEFKRVLMAYAERQGIAFSVQSARHTSTSGPVTEPNPIGDEMVPASRLRDEQRRADVAERRVAELLARNAVLTAEMQRLKATDDLIASGRRYAPTPTSSQSQSNLKYPGR